MNRLLLALLLSLGAVAPAHALRCGNLLIREGDTQGEVRAKCGEPSEVFERAAPREPRVYWVHGRRYVDHHAPSERVITFWVYNFGSSRLMQRLRFEDGVLVRVKNLGYGYEK